MADGFALRMDNLAYASAAERTMNAVSWMPGSSAVLPRAGVKPGATFSIAVLTGPDRVTVPAHGGMLLSTPASGATCYQYVLPTAVTKSFAARPGAGTSRIDLIVVRVYDATADVSTALKELDVEIIAGTAAASPVAPTQPNGTLLLGTATVPNAASIVITTPPPRTVATGGVVPVTNAADLATLVPYDGLIAFQEDTDIFYGRANGAWVPLMTGTVTYAPHWRGWLASAAGILTSTDIAFTTLVDTDSAWSGTVFTAKRAGVYRFKINLQPGSGGGGASQNVKVFKGGVDAGTVWASSVTPASFQTIGGDIEMSMALNDTATFRCTTAFTSATNTAAAPISYASVDWLRP